MTRFARRGFTLVEVLTVVSIVSILAAMLFSTLGTSKGRAKAISCASNLNQIGKALLLYVSDHDDALPPHLSFWDPSDMMLLPGQDGPWKSELMPYVRNNAVFFCPDDPFALRSEGISGVSKVHHKETSFTHPDWLIKLRDRSGTVSLFMSDIEQPAETTYLLDDAIGSKDAKDIGTYPIYPHQNRPNALHFDGHTKALPEQTPSRPKQR